VAYRPPHTRFQILSRCSRLSGASSRPTNVTTTAITSTDLTRRSGALPLFL
jgi:hypothetical protein